MGEKLIRKKEHNENEHLFQDFVFVAGTSPSTYNMSFNKTLELHLANWSNNSLDLDDFLVHLLTWLHGIVKELRIIKQLDKQLLGDAIKSLALK